MEIYLSLALFVALMLWAVITYNRFISLRRFKDEAWSGIAVQLKRRHDLLPNLLSLVKRYAQHEKELFEHISQQRTNLTGNTQEVAENERAFSGALGRLFAVAEAYPELRANENFLSLQQTLAEIEEQLQMARRYFNGTVRDFNILVESFPSLILASIFGFKTYAFFELEDPEDVKVPQMD